MAWWKKGSEQIATLESNVAQLREEKEEILACSAKTIRKLEDCRSRLGGEKGALIRHLNIVKSKLEECQEERDLLAAYHQGCKDEKIEEVVSQRVENVVGIEPMHDDNGYLMINGPAIAALRRKKHIGQYEVSKRMGCAPSLVSYWETGKVKRTTVDRVKRLARLLSASVDQIVMGGQSPIEYRCLHCGKPVNPGNKFCAQKTGSQCSQRYTNSLRGKAVLLSKKGMATCAIARKLGITSDRVSRYVGKA